MRRIPIEPDIRDRNHRTSMIDDRQRLRGSYKYRVGILQWEHQPDSTVGCRVWCKEIFYDPMIILSESVNRNTDQI
jgi:hypothetical protein